MPASFNSNPSGQDRQSCSKGLCRNPSPECLDRSSKSLHIGLINNMPDGALEATERQFLSLLNSASDGISIRLSLYALPEIPRNEAAARHIGNFYSSVESLWDTQLDGLIVTGREPLAPNLADEPYWGTFTKVLEWARDNTHSTVWSCLAAHAATLHMDGVRRIKSCQKNSGVFDCSQVSDHPLTSGTPSSFRLPHSRWNGLCEDELTRCGYKVLTRAADAGVDTFIKHCRSMFVFFQGHPEYEPNTLLLEYRRDVGRYLRGESAAYPLMPRRYFDEETVAALEAVQQEAMTSRREELLAKVSGILERITIKNSWHTTAACVYRNWLQYICTQKKLQQRRSRLAVQAHATDSPIPAIAAIKDIPTAPVFVVNSQRPETAPTSSRNILPILI